MTVGANVKHVVDIDDKKLAKIKNQYPTISIATDTDCVFNDSQVDAVVIALPVSLHYEMAKKALLAGKHVLVEKPMTDSVKTSQELIDLAQSKNKVLMCDHTFLYTGAVRKIKELYDTGELGKLQFFDSVRINLGLFQSDISVIWDLVPHDISILSYLVDESPISVSATGLSHTKSVLENISYITMFYESDFIAHANVSWISPIKIRNIIVGGDKKMVVYNDIEPTEKVKVYDTGYNISDPTLLKVDYRIGDIFIPKLDTTEALRGMALDFIGAIEKGAEPIANASLALNVVKIMEAADKSIKGNGIEVKID
jgi:predicted dehydrogenase